MPSAPRIRDGQRFRDMAGIVEGGRPGEVYEIVDVDKTFVVIHPVLLPPWDPSRDEAYYRRDITEADEGEVWPPPGFEYVEPSSRTRIIQRIDAMLIGGDKNRFTYQRIEKAKELHVHTGFHVPMKTGMPRALPSGLDVVIIASDMVSKDQARQARQLARAARVPVIDVPMGAFYSQLYKALERADIQPHDVELEVETGYGASPGSTTYVWDGVDWGEDGIVDLVPEHTPDQTPKRSLGSVAFWGGSLLGLAFLEGYNQRRRK